MQLKDQPRTPSGSRGETNPTPSANRLGESNPGPRALQVRTGLYGFIGTVIAGLAIAVTGHARADAIASLIVVALMLKPAPHLVSQVTDVGVDRAPSPA